MNHAAVQYESVLHGTLVGSELDVSRSVLVEEMPWRDKFCVAVNDMSLRDRTVLDQEKNADHSQIPVIINSLGA